MYVLLFIEKRLRKKIGAMENYLQTVSWIGEQFTSFDSLKNEVVMISPSFSFGCCCSEKRWFRLNSVFLFFKFLKFFWRANWFLWVMLVLALNMLVGLFWFYLHLKVITFFHPFWFWKIKRANHFQLCIFWHINEAGRSVSGWRAKLLWCSELVENLYFSQWFKSKNTSFVFLWFDKRAMNPKNQPPVKIWNTRLFFFFFDCLSTFGHS